MNITQINLKNFKRFTDLTISDIPESSKLVLLIGANGSGKSCVFDALNFVCKYSSSVIEENKIYSYYKKKSYKSIDIEIKRNLVYLFNYFRSEPKSDKGMIFVNSNNVSSDIFIGRSSNRIIPRIVTGLGTQAIAENSDNPVTFIDPDVRFLNDVLHYTQTFNQTLRNAIFKGENIDTKEIAKAFIEPLNQSLLTIFGESEQNTIQLVDFVDASVNTPPNLIFQKGDSRISYELLSHGEKQVVILLINFIVRQEQYKDKIIFIDEMDCHLNTTIQYSLLKEIVERWIPENSQLWTASHALGFIEYAQKSYSASILDFDMLDFDQAQHITPKEKSDLDIFEIAVPKSTLAHLSKSFKLVIVENKNSILLNSAFNDEGFLFLPAHNNVEVFLSVKEGSQMIGLRDRDYLKSSEIQSLQKLYPHYKILNYYTFENYLYHPDNIDELNLDGFNKEEYKQDILKQKDDNLLSIISKIATARQSYSEFKGIIKNDTEIKEIIDALNTSDFETFYKFFNMKSYYKKDILSSYNLTEKILSQTNWFKQQFLQLLQS